MSLLYKKIELIANLAIVTVALMIGGILVHRYFLQTNEAQTVPDAPIGQKLALLNVDWSQHKQTLVLALQEGCHFCTESAPFYQRLAAAAARRNVPVVVVLPQPVEVGRGYLAGLQVPFGDVRQATLGSLGVQATPTIMLVNGEGEVTGGWVGRLPAETESEVLRKCCDN